MNYPLPREEWTQQMSRADWCRASLEGLSWKRATWACSVLTLLDPCLGICRVNSLRGRGQRQEPIVKVTIMRSLKPL
jgi:hypothetical protein